jgi:Holliday junction resolvase
MSAGTRGTGRERQVRALALGYGWVVYRAAGSHGNADLVALKRGHVPLLIQVKASAGGPFEHFRPDERQMLFAEARESGARAFLAWWPARKPLAWYVGPAWEPHASPL